MPIVLWKGVIGKSLCCKQNTWFTNITSMTGGKKSPEVTNNRAVESDVLGFGIGMQYCGMRWKLNIPDL